MDASDPVSCLLCLSAYERSSMLRVHLRAIASDSMSVYYFCQRCGGAITAEYLYIQNSGKSDSLSERYSGEALPDANVAMSSASSASRVTEPAYNAEPAAEVREEKTIEATAETREVSAKGKKEGRKNT